MKIDYNICEFNDKNCCPLLGITQDSTIVVRKTDKDTTAKLPFPGGWKSQDITKNPYGGVYGYFKTKDDNNKDILVLDVVPNFSDNVWIGTHPYCNGIKANCSNVNGIYDNFPEHLVPKNWTGYYLNKNDDGIGIRSTTENNCNYCFSNPMFLCSTNSHMSLDSCPGGDGQYKLSNPPSIEKINNYSETVSSEYPRGIGRCIYPIDIIKNDDDLNKLINLKNNGKIHPELVKELALNYCYKDVNNKTCGFDSAGIAITTCNKYMYDKNTPANSPCEAIINELLVNPIDKNNILTYNSNWCNRDETKYTPLCDCIKSDIYTENGTSSDSIRKFYSVLTDHLNPNYKIETHKECWFKPCSTYALKAEDPPCPQTILNCNNIINIDSIDPQVIANNKQSLNCSINKGSHTDNIVDPSIEISNSSTIGYIIFFIIFIILIFIITINVINRSNTTSDTNRSSTNR